MARDGTGAKRGSGGVPAKRHTHAARAPCAAPRPHAHYLDGAPLADDAADPHAAGQARARGVCEVVLRDVAAQPVGDVQPAVVQADDDVSDQGGHLGQHPPLDLWM